MALSGCGLGVVLPRPKSGDESLYLLSLNVSLVIAGPVVRHRGRSLTTLQTLNREIASL